MRRRPLQHFPAAPLLHLCLAIAIADHRAARSISKRLNYRMFVAQRYKLCLRSRAQQRDQKNFDATPAKRRNRSRLRHYRVKVLSQV
jgi:hypothetical protein